ncbi:ankyrin [Gonapodya prolifera JEL478]|uniref:Ankyrin n=1 Tax=Gonapodya prolifera (strain JEL478) TaxID=1344416 RepID=A0A139AGR0_GONPJ|nr:ankyrin [Gonapodya prolifera JEL478]|eukprot:KXS16001.1 ankyrin [Gonapodya prolifera JEL478]
MATPAPAHPTQPPAPPTSSDTTPQPHDASPAHPIPPPRVKRSWPHLTDADRALHLAVREDDIDALLSALFRRAHPDVPLPVSGSTPLAIAAMHGNADAVRVLLEKGVEADPTRRDEYGVTPVHWAAALPSSLPLLLLLTALDRRNAHRASSAPATQSSKQSSSPAGAGLSAPPINSKSKGGPGSAAGSVRFASATAGKRTAAPAKGSSAKGPAGGKVGSAGSRGQLGGGAKGKGTLPGKDANKTFPGAGGSTSGAEGGAAGQPIPPETPAAPPGTPADILSSIAVPTPTPSSPLDPSLPPLPTLLPTSMPDHYGSTPLHYACVAHRLDNWSVLVRSGLCDPMAKDGNGKTPGEVAGEGDPVGGVVRAYESQISTELRRRADAAEAEAAAAAAAGKKKKGKGKSGAAAPQPKSASAVAAPVRSIAPPPGGVVQTVATSALQPAPVVSGSTPPPRPVVSETTNAPPVAPTAATTLPLASSVKMGSVPKSSRTGSQTGSGVGLDDMGKRVKLNTLKGFVAGGKDRV